MGRRRIRRASAAVPIALAIACGSQGSGSSGGGGNGGGGHWCFVATVNGSRLDLSAGGYVQATSSSVLRIEGDDFGACQHTVAIDLPQPVMAGTYTLAAPSDSSGKTLSYGQYRDCNLETGAMTDAMHTGTIHVLRADNACPAPPCIEATFGFNAYYDVNGTQATYWVTRGYVSDYEGCSPPAGGSSSGGADAGSSGSSGGSASSGSSGSSSSGGSSSSSGSSGGSGGSSSGGGGCLSPGSACGSSPCATMCCVCSSTGQPWGQCSTNGTCSGSCPTTCSTTCSGACSNGGTLMCAPVCLAGP